MSCSVGKGSDNRWVLDDPLVHDNQLIHVNRQGGACHAMSRRVPDNRRVFDDPLVHDDQLIRANRQGKCVTQS